MTTLRRRREALFWLILGLQVALFVGWHLSHLGGFQWGSDEGTYLMRVRLMQQGYRLYRDIWTDQLPGLIEALRLSFALLGSSVEIGRGLVTLAAAVGLISCALLARQLTGRAGALALVPLVCVLPNYFWLSRAIVSPDLPAISLGAAGLAAAGQYIAKPRRRWQIASGLLFAAALYVKATAILALLPAFLWLLSAFWHGRKRSVAQFAGTIIPWGLAIALPLLLALSMHDLPAMWRQFVLTQLSSGEMALKIGPHAVKIGRYLFQNNIGLSCLALLGLGLALRRKRAHVWIPTTWLGVSLAALLLRSPLWPSHHLVVLLYPLGILAACAVGALWRSLVAHAPRWEALAVVAAIAVYLGFSPQMLREDAQLDSARTFQSSLEAVTFLGERFPDGATVISDYHMIPYRAGCTVPPELATVTKKRIQLGLLSADDLIRIAQEQQPDAILFWDEQLTRAPEFVTWVKQHYVLGYKHNYHEIYLRLGPDQVQHSPVARLGKSVEMFGYSLPEPAISPGQSLEVLLYWRATAPIQERLYGFVHLIALDGVQSTQDDHLAWGEQYPSTCWTQGETIVDRYVLPVPVGTEPGLYLLSVGLYDAETKSRLPASDTAGHRLAGDQVILGIQPVVQTSPVFEGPPLLNLAEWQLPPVALLRSYEQVQRGDDLLVRLQWQVLSPPTWPSYKVFVHLRDSDGQVAQHDGVPAGGRFPTYAWRPGELVLDEHVLPLAGVAPGQYGLYVGLYDPASEQRVSVVDPTGQAAPFSEVTLGNVIIGGAE